MTLSDSFYIVGILIATVCVILLALYILVIRVCSIFFPPHIFNYMLNFLKWSILIFAGPYGLITFARSVTKISLLRISGDHFHPNLYDEVCSSNSSNNSLPTGWFEEVQSVMLETNLEQFGNLCLIIFIYSFVFAFIENVWFHTEVAQINELIAIANTIISTKDNEEESKKSVVKLMMSKVRANERYFLSFLIVEFLLFSISYQGSLMNTENLFRYPGHAVSSNGSEWTIHCDCPSAPEDYYTVIRCPYKSTDHFYLTDEADNICIVPQFATSLWCIGFSVYFLILGLSYCEKLILNLYHLSHFGLRKMNDMLLIRLMRNRYGSDRPPRGIIEAFEKELDERRTQLEGNKSTQQPGDGCNRDKKTQPHCCNFPSISKWSLIFASLKRKFWGKEVKNSHFEARINI